MNVFRWSPGRVGDGRDGHNGKSFYRPFMFFLDRLRSYRYILQTKKNRRLEKVTNIWWCYFWYLGAQTTGKNHLTNVISSPTQMFVIILMRTLVRSIYFKIKLHILGTTMDVLNYNSKLNAIILLKTMLDFFDSSWLLMPVWKPKSPYPTGTVNPE